eukprot:1806563-Pyramimonas_sp.AAC.1
MARIVEIPGMVQARFKVCQDATVTLIRGVEVLGMVLCRKVGVSGRNSHVDSRRWRPKNGLLARLENLNWLSSKGALPAVEKYVLAGTYERELREMVYCNIVDASWATQSSSSIRRCPSGIIALGALQSRFLVMGPPMF